MSANVETVRARRYLLGQASDEECAAIEQAYFEGDDAIDRMAAAEDDLIEEYLAGDLSPADRGRFEQSYLAVAHHRVRVETIRRLMAQASRGGSGRSQKISRPSWKRIASKGPLLALAASLLVVASVALWMTRPISTRPAISAETRAPERPPADDRKTSAPLAVPRIFALSVSPVAVRSAEETPIVVIPAGTDIVAMQLEGESDTRKLVATRASIQTVGGADIWQGRVMTGSGLSAGTIARVDVPAVRLPADDYIMTLYGSDKAGVEQAVTQYFLRVRER